MALFPRRIVQRELDLLRRNVLKPGQDKGIVGQLNSASRQALSIEWEVMLLGAFARHSRVEYEPQIGRRFPDLRLTHHKDGANLEFVADIVAVSDLGTKDKNAVDFLYE